MIRKTPAQFKFEKVYCRLAAYERDERFAKKRSIVCALVKTERRCGKTYELLLFNYGGSVDISVDF